MAGVVKVQEEKNYELKAEPLDMPNCHQVLFFEQLWHPGDKNILFSGMLSYFRQI